MPLDFVKEDIVKIFAAAVCAFWVISAIPARVLADGSDHWAFQPLRGSAEDDIDKLISPALRERGLDRSPRAALDRLLRRVHLLLIGLPPTTAELAAFRADPSPAAYEAVLDDLLARPGFGERWARHWLDLARYADSSGIHEDSDRPHAWRYRDYVIASFNCDKPFGQFIREQVAGDIIAPNDPQSWVATGFCRTGPSNEANIAMAELESYRLDQIDGILSTVSSVFLGQSIACARCHDHKTDPLTAADYYGMLSVFNNTVDAFVPISDNAIGKPLQLPIKARNKPKLPAGPGIRALTELPEAQWKATRILDRGSVASPGEPVTAAVPAVLRQIPANFDTSGGTLPRAALAAWIADPENALTWRVMANRVWKHLFGRGIVSTPSNFGTSGEPPTHPDLLEHLALSLRQNGGRIKPLIKKICLSKTFQQSGDFRESPHASDPQNRLYWRFPRHRLEAEAIRDSILFSGGNWNRTMGGPGIKPRVPREILGQSKRNEWPNVKVESSEHWRRSVYIYQKRQLPMPMMELLDAPDSSESCAQRFASTTPTQALALLNDAFVGDHAAFAARRAEQEMPASPVPHLIELIWSRTPTDAQLANALRFLENPEVTLSDLAVVLFNSSPFVYVD